MKNELIELIKSNNNLKIAQSNFSRTYGKLKEKNNKLTQEIRKLKDLETKYNGKSILKKKIQ